MTINFDYKLLKEPEQFLRFMSEEFTKIYTSVCKSIADQLYDTGISPKLSKEKS